MVGPLRKTRYLLCLLSGVLPVLSAQQIPAPPQPVPIDRAASTQPQQHCSQLEASDKRIYEVHGVFVPAGGFADPNNGTIIELSAFCRVSIIAKPELDSKIRIELWLPIEHWNGVFYGVGSGGGAGNISFGSLYPALRRGFAVRTQISAPLQMRTPSLPSRHGGPISAFAQHMRWR